MLQMETEEVKPKFRKTVKMTGFGKEKIYIKKAYQTEFFSLPFIGWTFSIKKLNQFSFNQYLKSDLYLLNI